MLQDIRSNFRGTFAKVIIAIICIPFVLLGVESIFSSGTNNKTAEVNGEVIDAQELNEAIFLRKRQLIAQMGDNVDPEALDDSKLLRPALDSLVTRKLSLQMAENNDFTISDQQINAGIVEMADFQEDGKFSQDLFQNRLARAGISGSMFKRLYATDLLLGQFSLAVTKGGFISAAEVDVNTRFTHETRDVRYMRLISDKVKQELVISDGQIEAFYYENPDLFQSQPHVIVEYLELKQSEFVTEVSDEEVQAAFDQELADLQAQTKKVISHILIELNGDKEAAMARIEAAKAKLAKGISFSDVAQEYSDDLGSKSQGGLLGPLDVENNSSDFPQIFLDAANALEENQVSDTIETDSGLHLIELTEIQTADIPQFTNRKAALIKELQVAKAEPLYWAQVEELKDVSFNAPDLLEPAQSLNKEIQTTGVMTRKNASGIFANPDILAQIFSDELIEEGLNSDVIEISEGYSVVFRIKEYTPAQLLDFSAAKAQAKAQVLNAETDKALIAKATDIENALKQGGDVEVLAKKMGLNWELALDAKRSDEKLPRKVLQKAFTLPAAEGKSKRAIGQVRLNDGDYAVLAVNNVKLGSKDSLNAIETQAMQSYLDRVRASSVLRAMTQAYKQESDIEYYR